MLRVKTFARRRAGRFEGRTRARWEEQMAGVNLSRSTIEAYTGVVGLYLRMGYRFTLNEFARWRDDELRRVKPATYNIRVHALNRYMAFVGLKYRLKPVSIHDQCFVEHELTREDFDRLCNGLLADGEYRWFSIFKLLATTGARISEFRQFTLEDVRRGYKDVLGKGSKFRRIWIPDGARREVLERFHEEGPFIVDEARQVRMKMHRFADRYGIAREPMHPHEFRHFFAREFYARTKDINRLKALMGHADMKTTVRYLRRTSESVSSGISDVVDW